MTIDYVIPWRNRLFRWISRPVFRMLFHILSGVRITGQENIPRTGAYVIAANHVSIYDPPLLVSFWPTPPEVLGAVEIWAKRGQSLLAYWYGGIPVHRGQYDRISIDKMLSALNSGRPLLVFPEGGRSHQPGMRQAFPGIAYLLEKADLQVIPVGITGTTEDFFTIAIHGQRPNLEMHIGRPFKLPPITSKGPSRRFDRQQNADCIMAHIAALLPLEYRGVYG